MARLVLLSFKSNGDAEAFAQTMCDPEVHGPGMMVSHLLESASVEWVIARPTKACECHLTPGTVKKRRGRTVGRTDGWTKGRTYGFWIHPVKGCGRVSKLVMERFVANLTGGAYDLLPAILDEPDRVPNDMRRWMPR